MNPADRQRPTPRTDQRILYVSDPSSIARKLLPDPVGEQDLRNWVDLVADSGVDIFDQEVFSQGWTVYWRSATYEYDRRWQHRRFLPLLDAGVEPLDILIDQTHKRGMDFIAGFRINDNHAHQAREQGVGIAAFIESNPHLHLTELPEGEYYKMSEPLDFTFAEVRDYTLGVFREVSERFAVDGVELCFRDHAYFPVGRGAERAHLMTDLVRQIRAVLDARGAAVGKKLKIGARVFATLEECSDLGLDVPTWISEGLIDYVSPQDIMYADFNLPYEPWAALTRAADCLLYPAIQPWSSFRARYRRNQSPITPANFRAIAHTMYNAGGDGIALYNHFVPTIWHPPFYPQAMHIAHQLRDPALIAQRERHYVFDPTWAGLTGFGGDGKTSTGTVNAQQLRLERRPQVAGDYRFFLYEDLDDAYAATLYFRGAGLTHLDELAVRLNGQLIPDDAIGRTLPSDASFAVEEAFSRPVGDQRTPCFAERGRYDFRAEPGPAFSTRWFALSATAVQRGENCLGVTLTESDPQATEPIVIDELEVWVDPRL